ncbi:MAG: hypothetical protein H0T53_07190 [Herpetosiphonaceae bacterium]|nr:hypothetical protein [Herpetosiphonaceae bacterium]
MPEDPVATSEQPAAQSPAIRGAALLGALIGLLSCAATRLGSIWYAHATLPMQSDMGERFAVGFTLWLYAGGVLLVSLVLTVVVGMRIIHRAQAWQPGHTLRVIGLVGGALVLWVALTSSGFLLYDLGLAALWTALHSLFASTLDD